MPVPETTTPGSDLEVLEPGAAAWDDARRAFNLAVDQQPVAIARPRSAQEVVDAVGLARERGLRVAVQGTGHGAGADLSGALLIRTERMRAVSVDPAARRVRAEAGALWGDVSAAAAPHGLAGPAGSSPTVGLVGYLLGGGVGWLSRRHGVACNDIHAVEMVTADGRLRRVDADHDPELFWALRGGGGGLGAITAVEVGLHEVGEVGAGQLFWPMERAGEVLEAWRSWSEDLPEDVSAIGRLLRLPPIPQVPEHLRGRAFALVEVADLRGVAALEPLLVPLRALGPEIDTVAAAPAAALSAIHMDPPAPVPSTGAGMLLSALPAEAVAAFVAAAGADSGSVLISAEMRRLGGAIARAPEGCGAVGSLDESIAMYAVAPALVPELTERAAQALDDVTGALAPWGSSRCLTTMAKPDTPADELYPREVLARLRDVASTADPDGLFVSRVRSGAGRPG